jgi:hypothetical protein
MLERKYQDNRLQKALMNTSVIRTFAFGAITGWLISYLDLTIYIVIAIVLWFLIPIIKNKYR